MVYLLGFNRLFRYMWKTRRNEPAVCRDDWIRTSPASAGFRTKHPVDGGTTSLLLIA